MTKPPLESSHALRAIIRDKRRRGELDDALLLARLGAGFAAGIADDAPAETVSRLTMTRFLALRPGDAEVAGALQRLPVAPVARRVRRVSIGRVVAGVVAAGSVALAGAHYGIGAGGETVASAAPPAFADRGPPPHTPGAPPGNPPGTEPAPVVIRAVGDVVLGTDYPRARLPGGEDRARLVALGSHFLAADIVVGNLEGVLAGEARSRKDISQPGNYAFKAPRQYARLLREMGFTVLNLANNHALDFGMPGLRSTISALREADLVPVGAPGVERAIVEVRGTRVAFLGYSFLPYLPFLGDAPRVRQEIAAAGRAADIVVVSVHAGREGASAAGAPDGPEYFRGEFRGDLGAFARLAVDAGASVVFGHGPHVLRPVELYRGRPIFYSLGNFVGYRTLSTRGILAKSLIAEVRLDPRGALVGVGIIPLKLDAAGLPAADYSAQTLDALTTMLGTPIARPPVLAVAMRPAASPRPQRDGAR